MLALSDPYLKYLQISLNLEGWNIGRYLKEVLVMQDKSIYYTKGSEKGGGGRVLVRRLIGPKSNFFIDERLIGASMLFPW